VAAVKSDGGDARRSPAGSNGAPVVRRAPFSSNPTVGARGAKAQQRLLDAALQVFGEVGYHQTGIVRITEVAGCSRASFYQYFSNKADAFRQLAADLGHELIASAEELGEVGPDQVGWDALRAFMDRHTAIVMRYRPIFDVFPDAVQSDVAVATGSARVVGRHVGGVRSKVTGSTVPPEQIDDVISLLLGCVMRAPRVAPLLRVGDRKLGIDRQRLNDALTDLLHRTLFGPLPEVNAREERPPTKVKLRTGGTSKLEQVAQASNDLTPAGARTRESLIEAATSVLVTRGYHGTRVDDVTEKAGVSHGAFYRYFDNKDELVTTVAIRALFNIRGAFTKIPTITNDADRRSTDEALQSWLEKYVTTYASEAALVRVWVDATSDDPTLGVESAGALEWGRSRLVNFLAPRGFGDIDADALLMIVLLEVLTAVRRDPRTLTGGVTIIERALVGID